MINLSTTHFSASIEDKYIIKDINFALESGTVTVMMGPNGSGKSTLAQSLMGHPTYKTDGQATLGEENLLELEPEERSKHGLFLSFQYPAEIEGVTVKQFLRQAVNAHRDSPIRISEFKRSLEENMKLLNMNPDFAIDISTKDFWRRKKEDGNLTTSLLEPQVAILDETDSGLDVDALKQVCDGIAVAKQKNPALSVLVITHYNRILHYLKPDNVIILHDGKIVKTGGHELVQSIEDNGYEQFYSQ